MLAGDVGFFSGFSECEYGLLCGNLGTGPGADKSQNSILGYIAIFPLRRGFNFRFMANGASWCR